jgi:hypothetical protein
MTLLNRSRLIHNGRVNVSAGPVTSCNSEATARSGVFCGVWNEANSGATLEHVAPRRQQRNNLRRCFLWCPPQGFIRRASCGLEFSSEPSLRRELSWSEWVSRETAVCELRPGANSWRKVPAEASKQRSAWDGRQPARTWARKQRNVRVRSCCQATLVKTVKSLV